MDGENKYYCDEFGKKIKVIKKYEFFKLPEILVFTLNRFEFNQDLGQRVKLNDYFEFPFALNMFKWKSHHKDIEKEFVDEGQKDETIKRQPKDSHEIEDDENITYELVGVVVHSGIAESGHYISHIKREGKWYEFNDSQVSEINLDAKITFEDWFSGPSTENMFTEINLDWPSNRKNAYMLFYRKIKCVKDPEL